MAQVSVTKHVGLARNSSDFFTFDEPSVSKDLFTRWKATCTSQDPSQQTLREATGAENRNWNTWYENPDEVFAYGTPRIWIKNNISAWTEYDVTLTFEYPDPAKSITVTAGTGGSASASASSATAGTTITITCSPNTGYKANTPTASGITFSSAGTNKWTFTMPASAVTISCTFSKINYNITVSAGTGGSGSSNKSTAQIGDTVTITSTPNSGYKANTPTATGITFTSAGTNKWTFTMPASAVTVSCTFSKINYNVTVSSGTGGSGSTDKSTAQIGDTVTITSTPSTGYVANKPTASNITFTSAGTNKWTFTMPAAAVSISCTFSKVSYGITTGASPTAGGTLTSDRTTANYGDTVILTRTAKTGYQFSSWTKTPSGLSIDSSLKFTMPAQNVSVTANFTKISYNVTVNAGTGGTAARDKSTAQIGDTVTVTCTPSTGYKANTPTASGITFTSAGTNKWTFTMPAAAVTVNCTFSKIGYAVTVNAGTGGTASASKAPANYGDTVTITCTPSSGYSASTPTATGITFTSAGANKWTFTMPAAAVTISCTFTKNTYTITTGVSPSGAGTLSSNKATGQIGDSIQLTRTAATGYQFSSWTKNPSGLNIGNDLKFSMPAQNTTVTANYTKINYTVTVNAGTGGSASASKAPANYGDTVTITSTPSAGYSANTPTATGITFTSLGNNKWSFTMPAAAVTISCTFSKISYNVTVSAGTGGSASRDKSTAQINDTVTITSTPSTGYKANTPTASGITFTSAGTNKWTFTMPASAVTVSCTFTKIDYTVTAGASPAAGGTLTSDKAKANYGDTVTLTRTAKTGYQFSSWTKTPSTLSIDSNLKFTMPAQNTTVTANFTKINYNVTVNAGTGGTAAASKTTANYGDTVTITCTPASGYSANTPTATGITFKSAGTNKWTFTMPAAAVTVSCTFTKINYAVTVTAGTGGSAIVSKNPAQIGDTITVTCSPNTGYKSNTPTATGITFTSAGTNKWTFTMPAAAVSISCTFSKVSYTVTAAASPAAGGTLTSNKATAYYGDTVQLTRTAAAGYQFSSWTKTPSGLSIDSNLKFTMPAQNVSVTANFTKKDYTVTVNAGTGGTASSNKSTAQIGDTVTITCAAASGYKVNTPTATGITFTSAGTNKWTFTMPAAAVTVSCTFSKLSYNVTVTAGTGGSAAGDKTTGQIGNTVTITCTPDTGYKANTPTATGITFTSAGTNKWTFTMPAAAVTVSCSFSKISYTITKKASPTGAGTVTTGANSAYYGAQVTVSQTPADGYYFNGWTITPNTVTVSSGKITMPAQNVTIQANYLKRSTASVNTKSVTGGGTVTLTINADKTTFSHKYKLSFGTGMETSLVSVAAGTNSVTISVPESWSTSIPNATTKTGGTLIVETYNGSTKIGTYTLTGFTYNVPTSAKPSIGTITTTIERTIGGTTYANVGSYYVQSKCGVRIQASGSGSLGSSISSLIVTISGYTTSAYKKTVNASSVDFTSGLLNASGATTITIKATDSRGRTSTKTKSITVTPYNKPSGTLDVWRVDSAGNEDPLGTYGKYSLTKTYTAVGSNSLAWSIKSQNVTNNSPAATGNLLPTGKQTFAQLTEYPITLTLTDAFSTVNIVVKLPTAQFMIYVNGNGDRIALMKATNESLSKNGKDGTIELSGNHQVYIGDVKLEDYIASQGQKYELITSIASQADFDAALDNKYSTMANNSAVFLRISTTGAFGIFESNQVYFVTLTKAGNADYGTALIQESAFATFILGIKNLTWTYQKIAMVSQLQDGSVYNQRPPVLIPISSDLDNYNTPGEYYVQSSNTAATMSHIPYTGSGGRLRVLAQNNDTDYFRQIYYTASGSRVYTRTKGANGWYNWFQFNMTEIT